VKPIMAPASASRAVVMSNLVATPLFTDQMFPRLWAAAELYGVDPVGVVAQSGKETGWGAFGGAVTARWYNTAGIKVRHLDLVPGVTDGDRPLAHQMFPNWEVGAVAHVQHLCAYAGREIDDLIVDPRYVWVMGQHLVQTWAELGGKWAPSPTYGEEIETIMDRLANS